MKIFYFPLIIVFAVNYLHAQKNVLSEKPIKNSIIKTSPISSVLSAGADTLIAHFTGTPTLYKASFGYVAGHNTYGDLADMQKFSVTSGGFITQILFLFGAKQGNGSITATIWDDNSGIPGNIITTVSVPFAQIDTNGGFTSALFPITPIPASGIFWAGFSRTYLSGDTVGLITTSDSVSGDAPGLTGDFPFAITDTYEQWADNTFHSYAETGNWGLDIALAVFPVIDTVNYNSISGTIYNDTNGDNIQDIGEMGIPQQLVKSGLYYSMTDANGFYKMYTDTGNYSVTHIIQNYLTSSPGSYNVFFPTYGMTDTGNNFAAQMIPGIQDLSVSLTAGPFRPGFQATYWIYYKNVGTQIENGSINLIYDDSISFVVSNPSPANFNPDTVGWNYTNLIPGEARIISVTMQVPSTLIIGTILKSFTTINPIQADTVPGNNSDTIYHPVQGSYDPNEKEVSPKGLGVQGYIGTGSPTLTYTVRFQNTGTDTAFNIVVIDSLDTNLDITTINFLGASHAYDYSISGIGVITFSLNNILLPDSNTNEIASHGFVKYSVNPKSNLSVGTQIRNAAYIYFDFNAPIVTDTTLNTIGNLTGINEQLNQQPENVFIYPNPVSDILSITYQSQIKNPKFEIMDVTGRKISSTQQKQMDVSKLPQGLYLLKITDGDLVFSNRFIKN